MARTEEAASEGPVLIGAVAQLYQGDLDFGRRALERLPAPAPAGVLVEDLSYGAVAVAQRLGELRPRSLVLVGAAARGRAPGSLERRVVTPPVLPISEQRQAVAEAITGYVSVDLVVEVAGALGALPPRTLSIELEPVTTEVSEQLSAQAEAALEKAVALLGEAIGAVGASPGPGRGTRASPGSAA